MSDAPDLTGLPGAEIVTKGLADIAAGADDTVDALLVWIAATRIRELGWPVPTPPPTEEAFELTLYRRLAAQPGCDDPYAAYNALLRRLVSFARAADHRHGPG